MIQTSIEHLGSVWFSESIKEIKKYRKMIFFVEAHATKIDSRDVTDSSSASIQSMWDANHFPTNMQVACLEFSS